jgi:hypothetical protein
LKECGHVIDRAELNQKKDPCYFVPVCLYSHTTYRTRIGLATLYEKYNLHQYYHLIVVADRLRALDNLITGRDISFDVAFHKARREAKEIVNLIKHTSYRFKAQRRGRIVLWDEIAEGAEFKEVAGRMRGECLADELLSTTLEEFVRHWVVRLGVGRGLEKGRSAEWEYLLSEVCMSVFCTENLGYWLEIWERPPAANCPDPIRLIYETRPQVVIRATGHQPRRILQFLYDEST